MSTSVGFAPLFPVNIYSVHIFCIPLVEFTFVESDSVPERSGTITQTRRKLNNLFFFFKSKETQCFLYKCVMCHVRESRNINL